MERNGIGFDELSLSEFGRDANHRHGRNFFDDVERFFCMIAILCFIFEAFWFRNEVLLDQGHKSLRCWLQMSEIDRAVERAIERIRVEQRKIE